MGSHMDEVWHDLWALHPSRHPHAYTPAEIGEEWTIEVGYGVYFETRRFGHPRGDLYWIVSRDCTQIERLKDMPPPDEMTKSEDWVP